MSLHEPSLKRLKESALVEGEKLAELFKMIVADAVLSEESVTDMIVHWLEPDDKFVDGTYVPEIHFVVRRIESDDKSS